jgi:hypothetical protein
MGLESARPALWRVVRFCHKRGEGFTLRELQAAVGCGHGAVKCFVWHLSLAGLAEPAGWLAGAGRGGAQKLWRLSYDIGPKCPVWRRAGRNGCLYDPNNGTVTTIVRVAEGSVTTAKAPARAKGDAVVAAVLTSPARGKAGPQGGRRAPARAEGQAAPKAPSKAKTGGRK